MLQFIFTDILMIALGVVLYLLVIALPRVAEDPEEKKSVLDRWAHSGIPERVDAAVNDFLVKFLRKVKVVVLKLDNAASHHLKKIKTDDAARETPIDFTEITGKKKEEE